jgi:hypothetical protein
MGKMMSLSSGTTQLFDGRYPIRPKIAGWYPGVSPYLVRHLHANLLVIYIIRMESRLAVSQLHVYS